MRSSSSLTNLCLVCLQFFFHCSFPFGCRDAISVITRQHEEHHKQHQKQREVLGYNPLLTVCLENSFRCSSNCLAVSVAAVSFDVLEVLPSVAVIRLHALFKSSSASFRLFLLLNKILCYYNITITIFLWLLILYEAQNNLISKIILVTYHL